MTQFERDRNDARCGNAREVLTRRRAEIDRLERELRSCKNGFRAQCIAQEIQKKRKEYNIIDMQF